MEVLLHLDPEDQSTASVEMKNEEEVKEVKVEDETEKTTTDSKELDYYSTFPFVMRENQMSTYARQ